MEGSDEKAIAIADSVMAAMGGRQNWDNTRYIHWNFFGARTLLWDKLEQKARVESHRDSSIYIVDLKNGGGMVKRNGEEQTAPDSIAMYTKRGEGMWINDSYWLVMPYKLKDSGVTLKYVGQDTTQAGKMADVLQLTFEAVGNTPNNKYLVYVDPDSHLVTQWDFFTNAGDEAPRFSTPWADYKEYGSILLSGDRGNRKLSNIAVYESVPEGAFTSLEPLKMGD
ncbi:hypothetical protein CRP01_00020 [Flavilitoribacter nigricans DSM 23189 = NBRC 102662]|uniref:Uncharacterized protein n=1 Tax=Flavilitoribacter nigricans (strain ATCC 23147 / DSM 23189 / NBRC 102662 / NCIMB 1420 / SS-2) TaxID=1122177 RepID=A0A2D0NJM1_FLAN2|nr:hypothetical protein CRP01_00020 [Flavilitoribacter nigricans DSM 23189 = NBRC 102662]